MKRDELVGQLGFWSSSLSSSVVVGCRCRGRLSLVVVGRRRPSSSVVVVVGGRWSPSVVAIVVVVDAVDDESDGEFSYLPFKSGEMTSQVP